MPAGHNKLHKITPTERPAIYHATSEEPIMQILVLNAGSSTLKFQLIATDPERMESDRDECQCEGLIEHFSNNASFRWKQGQHSETTTADIADIPAGVEHILQLLAGQKIDAVGHRVVHGGEHFSESALITDDVLAGIRACVEFAPLHNPSNIAGIEAIQQHLGPSMPQVAVFDTAFHQSMPEHAFLYAIPYELYEKHRIRRYGFHGTSHRYVAHRYRQICALAVEQTNIISLHLGNGCSAAAIQRGRPIDTSMGMTPLEGLVMGTRSGDVDATLITLIAEREGIQATAVETLLNHDSGLKGISGISNDMRELQANGERRAHLAIEIFCYRIRKYIGSYLAAMGGADAVIFTGGIGEHAPAIRAKVCEGLSWAGLQLDNVANDANAARISTQASRLHAFRIPTNEELLIARDTVLCILHKKPQL